MAVPWTKAKVFFFTDGDICFLVENVMFKIHREQIKLQKSDYFKKFLEKPKKDTDRPEDKPFHIQGHGKTPESFTHLCDVLYKLKIDPESPKRRAPAFHPKDPKLLLTLAKSTWIYECLVSHSLIQNTLPDWAPTFKELFTETPLEVLIDWVVVMDQKNPHSTPQEKEEHTKYRNKVMNTFYFRMLKEEHKDHNDPTSEHVGTIMKIGPGPGEECFAALLYCYLAYHSADQVETILSSKDNPVGACLDEWTVWSSEFGELGILRSPAWKLQENPAPKA
ncbi:hypothetical protein BD410DRAFT_838417 [Rickenella mellea]|uniref:BTB domain-containing protein n=1 Tax=Rickenella mellea TaxID=50990 RepID=A0A4Y7Q8D7_9AGAM|nr:hypothetical protein BD410DRAFT_838417 [Rickenella mellea]